jgi:hypothetical protein
MNENEVLKYAIENGIINMRVDPEKGPPVCCMAVSHSFRINLRIRVLNNFYFRREGGRG